MTDNDTMECRFRCLHEVLSARMDGWSTDEIVRRAMAFEDYVTGTTHSANANKVAEMEAVLERR